MNRRRALRTRGKWTLRRALRAVLPSARTTTTLFAQVGVAIAGVYGVAALIEQYQRALRDVRRAVYAEIDIAVPTRDLPVGTTILPDDLHVVTFRPEYLSDEAITDLNALVGRVVSERILEGDVVREERLAPIGRGVGIHAVIPDGMRATTIDLENAEFVSSWLLPGDTVDVIWTLIDHSGDVHSVTQTVLQAVRVVAVDDVLDQSLTRSLRFRHRITFALYPEQAEVLAHASTSGRLRFALRSVLDTDEVGTQATTTSTLMLR
ncbi:MAG: Flp pilus assembly protein CpaB [Myxococcota bacterium]